MTARTPLRRAARGGRWAAVGLAIAIFAGFGLAREEAKSPEPLETELIGIRNVITNASSKLKNDIVGVQTSGSNAPDTPAGRCCAWNLEKIGKRVEAAHRILEDFDRCYVNTGQGDMVLAGRVARSDLVSFSKALDAFAKAPNKYMAQGALQAMTRAYNLLRETATSLAPCAGVESLTEPDEAGESSGDSSPPKQSGKD